MFNAVYIPSLFPSATALSGVFIALTNKPETQL